MYECKICVYITNREKHFHRHIQSQKHLRTLPFSIEVSQKKTTFKCIDCKKDFTSWGRFNQHRKEECIFKCPIFGCRKVYKRKEKLEEHNCKGDDAKISEYSEAYVEKREEQKLKQFAIDEGFASIEEYREDLKEEVDNIFLRLYNMPTFMDWEMGDWYYPNEKSDYFLNGIKTKYKEEELEYLFN